MNIQFVFGPVAYANQAGQVGGNGWNTAGNVASQLTGMIGQATQSYLQARGGGAGGQVEMIERQLAPMLQIKPIDQSQVPPVFNGCLVLPANGADLTGGMSCNEASDPQVQSGYTEAIISIAEFNIKQLNNYTTKGHERFTSQGKGCYEQKITDFEGMLKAREEELNKMQNDLKERIEDFKRKSEKDLEEIRKSTALLTGAPARFLENINLGDQFFGANDRGNACSSVLDEAAIRRVASKGYNEIEKVVFENMNSTQNGKSTPDQILTSAKQYKDDVNKLAKTLSDRVKDQKDLSIDLGSTTFDTQTIDANNPALKRVSELYNKQNAEALKALADKMDIEQAVAGKGRERGQEVLQKINSGDLNLDETLRTYERDVNKECVATLIKNNFGSVANFTKEFRNPNVSRKLNERADSAFASEVEGWINDRDVDVDQALNHFSKIENKGLNSSKVIITGKSFTFRGKTISASTPLRISQFYRILRDNCKSIYSGRRNSDGHSMKDMVEKLRTYGKKVVQKRKTAATKLKSLLKKEMLQCPNDSSTGKAANSCSKAMNMNSDRFCLRTAQTCAGNFKGCHQKALDFRDRTFNKRDKIAKKYRKKAERLKKRVKNDLLAINHFVEAQARSLDAQLRLGTVFKTNKLDFNLNDTFFYKGNGPIGEGIPETLRMDDPEEMLKVADQQIEDLKTQLAQQKTEQLAKLNEMKDGYLANYEAQKGHWKGIIAQCNQRNQAYDKMVAEATKNANETDQKIQKACMELQAFNMANGPCGEVGDLMTTVQEALMLAPPGQDPQSRGLASYYDRQNLGKLYQLKAQCGTTQDNMPVRQVLPDNFDIKRDFCNEHLRGGTSANSLGAGTTSAQVCQELYTKKTKNDRGTDKLKRACSDRDLKNYLKRDELKDKKLCKEVDGAFTRYYLSSHSDKCTEGISSEDAQAYNNLVKDFPEVLKKFKEAEKLVDSSGTFKVDDNTKFKTQDNLNTYVNAKKVYDELKKKIEATMIAKANGDSYSKYDVDEIKQKENSSKATVASVSRSNVNEIVKQLNQQDSIPDFARNVQLKKECYFTDSDLAKEASELLGAALAHAELYATVQQSQRQTGQQNIALAMCNGNYNGAYDNHTIPGATQQTGGGNTTGVISDSSNNMIGR